MGAYRLYAMRPGYAGSVNLVTAAWGANLIAKNASTISVRRVGLRACHAAVSFSPNKNQKSAIIGKIGIWYLNISPIFPNIFASY